MKEITLKNTIRGLTITTVFAFITFFGLVLYASEVLEKKPYDTSDCRLMVHK